jgi:hypothetical protein
MLKKCFILFIIFFFSGCAQIKGTLFTPSDIERYCQKIFRDSGGSDALNTCIRQERVAKDELSGMTIPPGIERHCRQLAASTGGSYQVMLTCVQKEIPAKKR